MSSGAGSCRPARLRRCNSCGFEAVRARGSHRVGSIYCGYMRIIHPKKTGPVKGSCQSSSNRPIRLRRCNNCGLEQERSTNSHMIRVDGKRIFCGTMRLVR